MKIAFPYPDIPGIEVPDSNLIGVFSPSASEALVPPHQVIQRGLDRPIDSPRLGDLVRPDSQVLLLSDDNTRITPVADILPFVLAELRGAGIQDDNVRFLISQGSHRSMTPEEIDLKLGLKVRDRFEVRSHDWVDERRLIDLGSTPSGVGIRVNHLIAEADVTVGFGSIVPHRIAGFSGGGKIVLPGICGSRTTGQVHWASALYPGTEVLGWADNPMRRDIDAVALKAGLTFVINTVLHSSGGIAHLIAGHPVGAHRIGAELSRELHGVRIPQLADIVVIDSHPTDIDLWVAAKGFFAAELAVRPGGVVILVTPCPEGVAYAHPEVLEHGYMSVREVEMLVKDGQLRDLTAAAHIAHMGRIAKDLARGIIVSPGIGTEKASRLHLAHADTPQDALTMAMEWLGRDASVAIFTNGAEVLPIMEDRS